MVAPRTAPRLLHLGLSIAVAVATFGAGCAPASSADLESADSSLSATDLRAEAAKIRAEATQLAGEPDDIPQRAVFLHEMYVDSKGNFAFPEIALHGALWGQDYLRPVDLLQNVGQLFRGLIGIRHLLATAESYELAIKKTNRQVFIDTYTNYWFTKKFGRHPGAKGIIDETLLPSLNRVHAAAASGRPLSAEEQRDTFLVALDVEQKDTVAHAMDDAAKSVRPVFVKDLINRPVVKFAYFPATEAYAFEDFSDRADRVRCAAFAYDLAVKAGWSKVVDSMANYSGLPDAYFDDREGYAAELRAKLLE